jgi:hypothetical protein
LALGEAERKDSSFSEEKEAKRLLFFLAVLGESQDEAWRFLGALGRNFFAHAVIVVTACAGSGA